MPGLRDEAVKRELELVPERAQRGLRQPYAIVDIGSNSVRLIVYDELGRAPFPRFNEKSLCRLAAGLEETGELAPDGFRRTVEAARRFSAIAEAMGVARIDVLATEATRRASNGPDLVAAIAREAGLSVRILSGAEEATYAALGVISGFFRPTGLVGDMGGGSLEVAEVLDDRVGERWVSLPLGALPVERSSPSGARGASGRSTRSSTSLPPALTEPIFYAVGGGWRALAQGAHGGGRQRRSRSCTATRSTPDELRDFAKELWHLPPAKLAELPRRAGAARRDAAGGGPRHGPGAEATRARARRLLGARRARRLALRATA